MASDTQIGKLDWWSNICGSTFCPDDPVELNHSEPATRSILGEKGVMSDHHVIVIVASCTAVRRG